MSTQIIVAEIVAMPEHAAVVAQALEEAVHAVRKEPGCEQYDLHRDVKNPNRFFMLERWRDEEAVRQHAGGAALKKLAGVLESRAKLEVTTLEHIV
ncbi:putative quinol monooxygenase [Paraburkholderia unamae]|uniref:Quinol monooxygenase YgiN n=1 Tax=Paraburkholderia unamae TaxID=219649 RepID=A0ABX5KEM2_9BURK|nr:antibiotic biosynthesis monooxygenase family protein [Paraburkholderia unamae]PVX76308.1 quinol monooxygenase YgiN [Paraburkholderia unamae]RAR58358.1 quinol monooxygenase YgiN [Paraburkholderia unamae]CAG9271035.1 Quinol monooxygenase YgiN [Paraburkholderia unamae]